MSAAGTRSKRVLVAHNVQRHGWRWERVHELSASGVRRFILRFCMPDVDSAWQETVCIS
jgi:hypothetical protein